jgi:hypothetical protein
MVAGRFFARRASCARILATFEAAGLEVAGDRSLADLVADARARFGRGVRLHSRALAQVRLLVVWGAAEQ